MAAGVAQAPSYQHQHPFSSPLSYNAADITPVSSSRKLPSTSIRSLSNDERATTYAKSSRQHALRSTLRSIDTKMSASATTTTTTTAITAPPLATAKRSDSQHTKLHKRANSISSLSSSPAVPNGPYSHFATPYATYEEDPFPDIASSTPNTSTPKIKPYLRKLSTTGKEDVDQGRLDLSKSVSENAALAGLGITDFATLPRTDGLHSGRTTPHARNTSVGSTLSSGSGSFRPTQPFVHPMRQLPNRPYTPATDASSLHDDDFRESTDIVTSEDIPPPLTLHMGRSASISSNPAIAAPTPLSQPPTAADLGQVPKLTSTSQSNLSIHSSRSLKSSRSRPGRPRGDTNRSIDYIPTPSSRPSLDKSFSFVSRRSDHNNNDDPPQTRDERIQDLRRRFTEKEAEKERKAEQEELKRRQSEHARSVKKQERQRRQSAASASDRPKIPKMHSSRSLRNREDGLRALRYDQSKVTALPRQGTEPGKSEKVERGFGIGTVEEEERPGGWTRLSAWLQTRLLSCGRKGGRSGNGLPFCH